MQDIYQTLDKLEISYEKHQHPAVFTVKETDKLNLNIPGAHTKNLFLRNKKKTQYYLVSVLADRKVDLKKLGKDLGGEKLSFGSPDDLKKYLGLTPGSVSIFGLINEKDAKIKVIVDNDFFKSQEIGFHPNINTATLVIASEDLRKFLNSTGHEVIYHDFNS